MPTRQVGGGNNARARKHSLPLLVLLSFSCQISRAAEFNGNATFSCGRNNNLTATPIKWIGFQNDQKRNTHRACELTCWITDARSPPAWPPRDSRGWTEEEPRAQGHRDALVLLLNPTKQLLLSALPSTHSWERQFTYQRSHAAPASRAAERAEGETKPIWQVSPTFCWECCRATSPPLPPLAVSRCCETGADSFTQNDMSTSRHTNRSEHQ